MSGLDIYWVAYEATLSRIREEKPATFAALKEILDSFQEPSSAQAFFPDGADDTLLSAVTESGWEIVWAKAYYHYEARNALTGERFEYVEGDLYEKRLQQTCQWFARCENLATHTQSHPILGEVPICDRCQGIVDRNSA